MGFLNGGGYFFHFFIFCLNRLLMLWHMLKYIHHRYERVVFNALSSDTRFRHPPQRFSAIRVYAFISFSRIHCLEFFFVFGPYSVSSIQLLLWQVVFIENQLHLLLLFDHFVFGGTRFNIAHNQKLNFIPNSFTFSPFNVFLSSHYLFVLWVFMSIQNWNAKHAFSLYTPKNTSKKQKQQWANSNAIFTFRCTIPTKILVR